METVEKVAEKVLQKLESYVETVTPEKLSPQSMKHVTATLKDIRELTTQPENEGGLTVRVEFAEEIWSQ